MGVHVVAAKLGHQATGHQIPVREGGHDGLQAARVVEEGGTGGKQQALEEGAGFREGCSQEW